MKIHTRKVAGRGFAAPQPSTYRAKGGGLAKHHHPCLQWAVSPSAEGSMAHGAGEPGLRGPMPGLTTIAHAIAGLHLRGERMLVKLFEDFQDDTLEA